MKSLFASQHVGNESEVYSDLMVLQSAAGYYVGTTVTTDGFTEPGSRDSDYFPTHAQATAFLETVTKVVNPQEYLRDHP